MGLRCYSIAVYMSRWPFFFASGWLYRLYSGLLDWVLTAVDVHAYLYDT